MFSPTREEVRRFFLGAWSKYRSQAPLEGLEQPAVAIMVAHPEFHPMLDAGESALEQDFDPEGGELNPFLHLSLHLAVSEQLSIDQPRGIGALHAQLRMKRSEHDALHVLLECLGETVWQSQRTGSPPDEAAYLDCIRRAVS
jgi:hypothetical protein